MKLHYMEVIANKDKDHEYKQKDVIDLEKTERYIKRESREINKDFITEPWVEIGFNTMNSPEDPVPSIRIENSVVVEMDGKKREDFDTIDYYIADYGIDKTVCEEAMAMPSNEIARKLVDINVSREEILRFTVGLTPAKLVEIVSQLNIVEIMMTQMKMRARKSIANQAHVTNLKDNPVLMAADAAEATLRGFAEIETTAVVNRYAPFNAIALLVGGQVGRPGSLSQCSLEEAFELQIGIQGLTTYAETLSVYGTEGVFTDGDDTPWSKAFLAAAYTSRGIKVRFSSGTGSEVLMGDTEGHSMLYLEARCICLIKASGVQGVQNGSLDGIGLVASLPGGLKTVTSENLIVSLLGMEVASGNDTWFTSSDMRRTSKVLVTLLAGTDFIASGYAATPNYDNVFAGSLEDIDDYNDHYMFQRDYVVDGGIVPAKEEDIIHVRRRAGKAMQAIFDEFGFAPITDEEIEAAVYAYGSDNIIDRNVQNDMKCAEMVMRNKITGLDIALALKKRGFDPEANAILHMMKQRVAGDYLHTSAILDENFVVLSAVNDANDYKGPGTGYKINESRMKKINACGTLTKLDEIIGETAKCEMNDIIIEEIGEAEEGKTKDEVVVIVSPSFGESQKKTLGNVAHLDVLNEISAGLEEESLKARFVKCYESADLGVVASVGSQLSGSGISIGIQSKGTTVIHQKGMSPLMNLELFSQGPQLDRVMFRKIGKNAGKYAKGEFPTPLPTKMEPEVRRFMAKSAVLHSCDMNCVVHRKAPVEFKYDLVKGEK